MNSLGFDTLIINAHPYSDESIKLLLEIFAPLDVRNFVFLHEFDQMIDPLSVALNSARSFEQRISPLLPRGVRTRALMSIKFSNETLITPELHRLCPSRKVNSLFVSLPIFPDTDDNDFATALNRLLYRSKIYPILSSFESIRETSPKQFSDKLLTINSCGFAFDINYLFKLDNLELTNMLAARNVSILPCISHDPSCYAGIADSAQYFIDTLGKQLYYKLCSQMNRSVLRVGL